ncbi:hypothetical protein SUGI_0495040, partial [Cryptomeria japonica]
LLCIYFSWLRFIYQRLFSVIMRYRSPNYSPSPRRGRYRTPSYSPSPRRRHYRSPSYSPSPYRGHYRSPSYSPSPKRRRGRSPSYSLSPRNRHYRSSSYSSSPRRAGYYRRRSISSPRKSTTSLLVRNLHPYLRVDDLRGPFREFGPIKDIYLPRDYYTGEPRGFGFVQFFNPAHAADAKYYMDRQIVQGREIAVVFAEESRKTPYEMRSRQRSRYGSYHSRSYERSISYSLSRSRSRSLSRSCSLSPRRRHYSRQVSLYDDRQREGSYSYLSGSRSSSQRISLSRSRSPPPEKYSHRAIKINFSKVKQISEVEIVGLLPIPERMMWTFYPKLWLKILLVYNHGDI